MSSRAQLLLERQQTIPRWHDGDLRWLGTLLMVASALLVLVVAVTLARWFVG